MENQDQKSVFNELLINIILPTFILNKGAAYLGENGPTKALIVALIIPLGYALYDLIKNKNKNFISFFGFLNILLTGGLGLFGAGKVMFVMKETIFPLLIGIFVLFSAFRSKPMISMLIGNDQVVKTELIDEKLNDLGTRDQYKDHLKTSTIFFSVSFFLSAVLNFILANRIFTDIPSTMEKIAREQLRNEQIAQMTWQGYVVILVPSMIALGLVLWHLFRGIQKYTGLNFNEIMRDQKKQA